jgi:hypothetical protein
VGVKGLLSTWRFRWALARQSSNWPAVTGSAVAYGLTDGANSASQIALTALGRRLVAPEEEGADIVARREATLRPRIMREFFEKYDGAKFPSDVIGVNVLRGLGVPQDRAESAMSLLRENGVYAGILRNGPTGQFVSLGSPVVPAPATTAVPVSAPGEQESSDTKENPPAHGSSVVAATGDQRANKVFITHGREKSVVAQIKELLTFGNFEPIVSVERESTAVPVPEKVFEDMRACGAGVIHVGAEGKFLDTSGAEHTKINDNVLIEIGAAMALFGKKVILLVEKGITLPSNLQGLYRCEYEGGQLNYEATMKLLKTFSQFR